MAGDFRNGSVMARQRSRSPPFSIQLLEREHDRGAYASRRDNEHLLSLLPASYRTESDDLAAPARHVAACVDKELDLRRLTSVGGWLWVAGRPMPPRPLHYQILLSRDILIAEWMDMHLVWTTGRIFIKPIPRFLLEPRFWTEYLCCGHGCGCSIDDDAVYRGPPQKCERRRLRERALGFLFSYAALISHESDFRIAVEKHLLPPEVRWPAWRTFVEQLDTEHIYPDIDPRFYHGELRLSRLNNIYRLWQTPLRGYMPHWNQYGSFFRDNFAWLAGTTVYIAVVLAAMQVGLATETLKDDDAFQSASYGFAVFSILGPLICAGLIVLAFSYIFVQNWIVTVTYKKRRLQNIGTPTGRA
ncbi:hypothetical protein DER44DRAFT_158222 [Fusarium oxysporum]|nr:hypothetical protein DER44DRAFT_158222 [Fusarium oxysporum]